MDDAHYMSLALEEAKYALDQGEFPVGCVIADQEQVITKGRRTGTACGDGLCSELSHAEINALKKLEEYKAQGKRISGDLVLYSTLEPCLMCYAASALAGIKRLVFAYEDVMGGGVACDLRSLTPLYRDCAIQVTEGVARQESIDLFYEFFQNHSNSYWQDSLLALYTLEQK